ncbi:unnamed protein product [Urochloa decumbens]|uniref:Uncharacterized protein n=1 Tax=Urochloa decumbens TaxID=240449 RepID=A0ABC9C4W5_9POAL
MKVCRKVNEMIRELDDLDYDIPTMMAPKDPGTTKAVQSSKDKVVVLRAARSIVSVAYITDDGQRLPRCTALLDVQLQEDISDIGIDGGFVVDEVFYYSAEKLGIKRGNVIISINGQDALTLPELEDCLLSLGWDYLKDESICMKDLKLRVCDLKSGVKRDVALPVTFYDKAERFQWI